MSDNNEQINRNCFQNDIRDVLCWIVIECSQREIIMEKKKQDRRVQYTKKVLGDALVSMIMNQHISSVSVKELCEKADINRSTFYAHYKDPFDLLCQIEKEVISRVRNYLQQQNFVADAPLPQQMLTSILVYARENRDLFMVLLGENSDYLINEDILSLTPVISEQYRLPFKKNIQAYMEAFGVAGAVSVFQKWLKEDAEESPDEISRLVVQLLQNGIYSMRQQTYALETNPQDKEENVQ